MNFGDKEKKLTIIIGITLLAVSIISLSFYKLNSGPKTETKTENVVTIASEDNPKSTENPPILVPKPTQNDPVNLGGGASMNIKRHSEIISGAISQSETSKEHVKTNANKESDTISVVNVSNTQKTESDATNAEIGNQNGESDNKSQFSCSVDHEKRSTSIDSNKTKETESIQNLSQYETNFNKSSSVVDFKVEGSDNEESDSDNEDKEYGTEEGNCVIGNKDFENGHERSLYSSENTHADTISLISAVSTDSDVKSNEENILGRGVPSHFTVSDPVEVGCFGDRVCGSIDIKLLIGNATKYKVFYLESKEYAAALYKRLHINEYKRETKSIIEKLKAGIKEPFELNSYFKGLKEDRSRKIFMSHPLSESKREDAEDFDKDMIEVKNRISSSGFVGFIEDLDSDHNDYYAKSNLVLFIYKDEDLEIKKGSKFNFEAAIKDDPIIYKTQDFENPVNRFIILTSTHRGRMVFVRNFLGKQGLNAIYISFFTDKPLVNPDFSTMDTFSKWKSTHYNDLNVYYRQEKDFKSIVETIDNIMEHNGLQNEYEKFFRPLELIIYGTEEELSEIMSVLDKQ